MTYDFVTLQQGSAVQSLPQLMDRHHQYRYLESQGWHKITFVYREWGIRSVSADYECVLHRSESHAISRLGRRVTWA